MTTWTPTALSSEARPWAGSGWRAVEAQHLVATMGLAHGKIADQAILEDILEAAKPRLPAAATNLHWLLATPFRYWPRPHAGSRFRARLDAGVFYGAEDRQTACAECGYWRLRFWLDSAGLAAQPGALKLTLFEFHATTPHAIDLSRPPLADDRVLWTAPADYRATQTLANQARQTGIDAVRYESVRNPGGHCLALLTPQPFRNVEEPYRHQQQSWNLLIEPPDLTVWQRELSREGWSFRFPEAMTQPAPENPVNTRSPDNMS